MDELGKSFPAAEGMVDAEQSTKGAHVNENCLNCGTPLTDSFCQHCGQKDIPRRQTLGELFSNFISSFWSYEGKFFRTTKFMIIKPGFLATEYNAGRRESYYHPARMYVFVSFLFFLIWFSLPEDNETTLTDEDKKELGLDSALNYDGGFDSTLSNQIQDSVKKEIAKNKKRGFGFNLSASEYKSVAAYDSAQNAKPEDKRHGWLLRRLSIRGIELSEKYKDKPQQFTSDFGQLFKDNFSKVLFYLLPFFALVLKLLYIRRDFYYSEHLVQSIYYYNFFYLAGSLILLIDMLPWLGFLSTLLSFWIYFYFLFAMKEAYKQSWSKTILKFALFSFLFGFLIFVGFAINAIIAIMII